MKRNPNTSFQAELEPLVLQDYQLALRSRRALGRAAAMQEAITAFVLTCPAYANDGNKYTFTGGLSGEVPMMVEQHLKAIDELAKVCVSHNVELSIVVLLADIEAYNQPLCDKYTGGSKDAYLKLCAESVNAIDGEFRQNYESQGISFTASSFLDYFVEDNDPNIFLTTRSLYKEVLYDHFSRPGDLRDKVNNNVRSKRNDRYYQREYGEMKPQTDEVLVNREITTMAEYLALGHLIDNSPGQPLIVVHRGVNDHLFNERNRFLLPDELNTSKQAIPLLIRQKAVY